MSISYNNKSLDKCIPRELKLCNHWAGRGVLGSRWPTWLGHWYLLFELRLHGGWNLVTAPTEMDPPPPKKTHNKSKA